MPNYKCINSQCSLFEELMNVANVSLYYDKGEGRVIDTGCRCPECNKLREQIREPGMTTVMLGSDNICKK